MTDNVYAAPVSSLDLSAEQTGNSRFFVVAPRKLATMYIGTMGLYFFHWFYKQWENYKESQPFDSPAGRIWPVMRAIFSAFFIHSLFSKVKTAEPEHPAVAHWHPLRDATLLLVVLLVPLFMGHLLQGIWPAWFIQVAGVSLMIPTVLLLRAFQRRANAVCGDPEGQANAHLSGANIGWLVFGALFWLSFAVGVFAMFTGVYEATGDTF